MLFLALTGLSFFTLLVVLGVDERPECRPCRLAGLMLASITNAAMILVAAHLIWGGAF